MESVHGGTTFEFDSCFRKTKIEDLCLDFTLPGYPDFVLSSRPDNKMVSRTPNYDPIYCSEFFHLANRRFNTPHVSGKCNKLGRLCFICGGCNCKGWNY